MPMEYILIFGAFMEYKAQESQEDYLEAKEKDYQEYRFFRIIAAY